MFSSENNSTISIKCHAISVYQLIISLTHKHTRTHAHALLVLDCSKTFEQAKIP